MRRLANLIAPPRMGRDFPWLIASEWSSNLGDGIALAAGPLLIASQTSDPRLVGLATVLQQLPWLLFGLHVGWVADRVDRRRLLMAVNSVRALLLVGLAVVIATGQVNVGVVLGALFLLGTAETFVDTTISAVLPMVVAGPDLGVANARIVFGRRSLNQLAGPALGAGLFIVGMSTPYLTQAVLVGLSVVLISRLHVGAPADMAASAGVRSDIAAGLRWLSRNPPVRTLTLTVVLFNVTFGAMWPMLVLYARERLGVEEAGFGVLLSASAVGGVCGALAFGWLERHASFGNLMRFGLTIETFVHLGLARSTSLTVSMAILFAFGFQASVWGTISSAVRQRAVPEDYQGRLQGVYGVGVFGGLVVGGLIGVGLAGIWGTLAPFYFAFAGSAVMLSIIWRELPHIVHLDEPRDVFVNRNGA